MQTWSMTLFSRVFACTKVLHRTLGSTIAFRIGSVFLFYDYRSRTKGSYLAGWLTKRTVNVLQSTKRFWMNASMLCHRSGCGYVTIKSSWVTVKEWRHGAELLFSSFFPLLLNLKWQQTWAFTIFAFTKAEAMPTVKHLHLRPCFTKRTHF